MTSSPVTTVAEPATPAMTRRQTLEALSGIMLGMFASGLAMSIVSTSLPRIITDLSGGQSAFTWVVTATLLTSTISTPIWGKLADVTDRKMLVQIALTITVIGAAAAGLAQNVGMLIGFRAVQGIGAGGLMALSTVLLADIISPRERGKYMGLLGAVMGVVQVGGPVLGGWVTDSAGWRWNFFLALPIALAAIILLQRTLHLPALPHKVIHLDYLGATLISVGVATLLLWVTFAGDSFAWMSWQTAAMLTVSLLSLVAAVIAEMRVSEPIIPMRLFRNRTLVVAVIASAAVGVAMFGSAVFLSQYMQLARGKTPTVSGLLTIPMVVGLFLASTISGALIARTGRYKGWMLTGTLVLTAGLGAMGTIDYLTPMWEVSIFLFAIGAGVGMLMQNLVLAVQNTLPLEDVGSGTATVAFFRTLGGAVGVSVLGAVLSTRVTDSILSGLAGLGIDANSAGLSTSTLPDLSTLPDSLRVVVESAYGDGVAHIFQIGAPLALIAGLALLFLQEVPLGSRSGIEQRMAAGADTDAALAASEEADPMAAGPLETGRRA